MVAPKLHRETEGRTESQLTSHWTTRVGWKTTIAAVLVQALLVLSLVSCASGSAATPVDLTPPVAATVEADISASSGTAESGATVTPPGAASTEIGPEPSSDVTAPTLMSTIAAGTRHFQGDPSAPVTIIEFGDFR